MLETLRRKSRDPSVNPYQRLIDPDLGMPDVFYMMDEIGRMQVLRKFRKNTEQAGDFCYCGTYRILHKTERGSRFCLVMHRTPDERRVPAQYEIAGEEELQRLVIAEYYPGVMSRIYLKGLPEDLVQEIMDEFIHRALRRKKRKRLSMNAQELQRSQEDI